MFEVIDSAAEDLRNKDAGWVTRRDGADLLGKFAIRALSALHAASDEPDVDVRRAVENALGQAAAALEGVKPRPVERSFTLEELVRASEKPGERELTKVNETEYRMDVTQRGGRKQSVHIRKFQRKDGIELIQVYTICGKADESSFGWALRANMKLVQGAIAIETNGDDEQFVLTTCFIADHVTRWEMKAAIKETAYYGDWMENKLTGQDEF
jgi:hypothetical protein